MTALLKCLPLLLLPGWTFAQNSRGTFANPKTGVKWRYWIEDSSADLDVLRSDVAEMAKVGSSGFELLSYQSYGGLQSDTGEVIIDPTDVAFGSDNFVKVTATLIQAAKEHNLTIDFTLGPNQGAGVPVEPDDVDKEGMLTELVFGSHFLQPGESFDGQLPAPVVLPYVANDGVIRSANTTQKFFVGVIGAQLADGANTSAPRVSLDFNTVVDLTDAVQRTGETGTLSWVPSGNGTNVVLAFYYRRNGFPEARGGFNGPQDDKPGSWGSFVVDHFSAKGVNVSSSFIQNNILSQSDIGEMLAEPGVGRYMWEDSMEFQAQVWWTDSFAQRFEERHNYSVGRVLPILHALLPAHASFSSGLNVNQTFDYGSSFNSYAFAEDYRDTLSSLYIDYMTAFNEWSHSIGLLFSNQPAYDFQIDVAASAAIPDVPEIESLALPLIDEARQLSGGVHLGNRSIFSSETAARPNFAVSLPMSELLADSKAQFAGHVNLLMLHGYPYSGPYPNTTWPGICTFAYRFADMHGPKMPAWNHYEGYLNYLARNQYILQSGTPKVDVALYRKGYDFTRNSPSPFPSSSLISAGYTYEYVSPENFKLPGVFVSERRLALGGPAYKAFILSRIQNITIDGAQSLIDFANDGLPIVIAGGVPDSIPGFDADGTQNSQVQALMEQLTALPTVKVVDDEEAVPGALGSLGVVPATSIDPPTSTLWTIRRDEASDSRSTSYFFLYNQDDEPINGTLTLTIGFEGTPFILDAWSGTVNPIFIWNNTSNDTISIPEFSLAAGETALITITSETEFEGIPSPSVHVTNADLGVFAGSSTSGSFELRSTTEGSKEVILSNGDIQTVEFSLEGETIRELTGWQLNITKWTPPEDLSQIPSVLVPGPAINLTQGLVPWDELEGHENTSGVGTYVTTFEWNHATDSNVGIRLDLGSVVHTIKAWLNGVELSTADPTHPEVDISELVQEGSNLLRVDAASTLLNVVNSVPEVMSLGQLRIDTVGRPPERQHYGLIAPVRLIPYGRVTINL
ncbi:secreted protein [Moniliophthora roreri]|uniref:Secreted protein n=1 Tax=Moniliophthora roreri TaxID=221103 RepID=A0A0W0F3Y4_MONRR|nr:secreted protein [Moniliophthora roreri]